MTIEDNIGKHHVCIEDYCKDTIHGKEDMGSLHHIISKKHDSQYGEYNEFLLSKDYAGGLKQMPLLKTLQVQLANRGITLLYVDNKFKY